MIKMTWSLTALSILLGSAVLLGTLQHADADPRPDFAIKATITGTTKVVALSNQVSTTFDKVSTMNLPLTAGYNLLTNMKAALLQIGSKITTAGKAITTALNALAGSSSNNVDATFQTVTTAIQALSALLQTGLTTQLGQLHVDGTTYIADQFIDSFNSINSQLTTLSGALDRLKAGVKAALNAPGNTATGVSSKNLSKYVTPSMVTDVQNALVYLNADIPLVKFIIEATQNRLSLADAFVTDMQQEASDNISAVDNDLDLFKAEVVTIGETIADTFTNILAPVYGEQLSMLSAIQSTIQAISTYTLDLEPALVSLAQVLDTTAIAGLGMTVESAFTQYNTDLDSSIAGASAVQAFFVGEACQPLKHLVDGLAASGYYANYCFTKYASTVFNQFAMTFYLVSECYSIETVRLQRLQDLMALIVQMIVYDIENLGEAVTSCQPLNDGSSCLTLIGPFYETLAGTIDDKQTYLLNYIETELQLSLQRVTSCVTVAKYSMVTVLAPIAANVDTCTVTGYAS